MVEYKKYEQLNLDELVRERNHLIGELRRFENNQITEEEKMRMPSPLTIYQVNNDLLIEVTKCIQDRIHEIKETVGFNKLQKFIYREVGFRPIYHRFVIVRMNKLIQGLVQNYPHCDQADCVLCYGYIDQEAGCTLDIIACGKENNEGYYFFETSHDTRSILRIESVMDHMMYYIDDQEHLIMKYEDRLELLENYKVNDELEKTRQMDFLDNSRNQIYPDDVLVWLLKDDLDIEKCWVRIIGHGDTFIIGDLLNEPYQDFGYHKGDRIAFHVEEHENQLICVSIMDSTKKLTYEDLEDGSMLKEAIVRFNHHRTEDNLFNIMELLRDSYVWIPCHAILAQMDVDRLEEMLDKDDLESNVGKTFVSENDIRLIPDILENEQGYYFPVFSSCDEMGEYGNDFSKIQKHFIEAIHLASNNEKNVLGIVVNAFSDSFIIPKDLFEVIEKLKSRI